MASDCGNPGEWYFLATAKHWQYVLTLMADDREGKLGDFTKLEKAVQQAFNWLDKNKHATSDQCYAKERQLMRFGEEILYRSNTKPSRIRRAAEQATESSSSAGPPPQRRREDPPTSSDAADARP